MRSPSDMPQTARPSSNRRRRWIIAAVIIVIILIASLRTFAVFYTDALWFSSVSLHSVWVKLFEIKVGLMVVFAAIFAVLLLASLLVAERLAPKGPSLDAEDEFVKRYQEVIGPYARWLRAGVVVVLSLIVGSQAIGQWHNWILFRNSTPFAAIRSAVPPQRRLLRLHPPLRAVPGPLDPGGPVRGAAGHPAQPLPERRHPDAGLAAPGPPGGQGPHLGHPRPAGPGQGGRLLPGPLQPRPLVQRVLPGRRATPTCTPGSRPSSC